MNKLMKSLVCLAASVVFICPVSGGDREKEENKRIVNDAIITCCNCSDMPEETEYQSNKNTPIIRSNLNPVPIVEDDGVLLWYEVSAEEQDSIPEDIYIEESSEKIIENVVETVEEEPSYEYEEESQTVYEEDIEEDAYNPTSYSGDDVYILAHLLCGEAMDCSWDVQVAVGSVVLNRVSHYAFPGNIYDVVFQEGQYACTWDGNYYRTPTSTNWEVAEYLLTYGSHMPWYVIFQSNQVVGDSYYSTVGGIVFSYNSWDLG